MIISLILPNHTSVIITCFGLYRLKSNTVLQKFPQLFTLLKKLDLPSADLTPRFSYQKPLITYNWIILIRVVLHTFPEKMKYIDWIFQEIPLVFCI